MRDWNACNDKDCELQELVPYVTCNIELHLALLDGIAEWHGDASRVSDELELPLGTVREVGARPDVAIAALHLIRLVVVELLPHAIGGDRPWEVHESNLVRLDVHARIAPVRACALPAHCPTQHGSDRGAPCRKLASDRTRILLHACIYVQRHV